MRPALAAALAGGAAAVLLATSVLLSDGSSDDRLTWIGPGGCLFGGGEPGRSESSGDGSECRRSRGAAGSFSPCRRGSWSGTASRCCGRSSPIAAGTYFNRGFVYLALALVGVFVGSYVRGAVVLLAGTLAVVFAAAVGLGATRESGARPGCLRRAGRAAEHADRVLERACAADRHGAAAGALACSPARASPGASGWCDRVPLRRGDRAPAHVLARGDRCGCPRGGSLVLARVAEAGGRRSTRAGRAGRDWRRALGFLPAGAGERS